MYKFFCLKIEIKTKADSYMPCKAMAHSTKYKLKEEASLLFDILWAMDGNDSLRRFIRRSAPVDGDSSIPGPSCE
jgi:hypothetical protein